MFAASPCGGFPFHLLNGLCHPCGPMMASEDGAVQCPVGFLRHSSRAVSWEPLRGSRRQARGIGIRMAPWGLMGLEARLRYLSRKRWICFVASNLLYPLHHSFYFLSYKGSGGMCPSAFQKLYCTMNIHDNADGAFNIVQECV